MHMGESRGSRLARPFATLEDGTTDGAISASGTVMGSYLHGLFASADLRRALLDRIGVAASGRDYHADVDTALNEMAAELARHVDVDGLLAQIGRGHVLIPVLNAKLVCRLLLVKKNVNLLLSRMAFLLFYN